MVTPAIAMAAISAGAAVIGSASAVTSSVEGDTGVHVSPCSVHFPKEFPPDQYAEHSQEFNRDLIKFVAEGYWTNTLIVSATGFISNDHSPVAGIPTSSHPNVPINRFVILTFQQSGHSEDMSRGLLTVNIGLWGGATDLQAEGTPEEPWIPLHVHGRFDPVGIGDVRYEFKLDIDTFGNLRLSNTAFTGTTVFGGGIHFEGDHVVVGIN